jgi:hypothetical protein
MEYGVEIEYMSWKADLGGEEGGIQSEKDKDYCVCVCV